MVAPARSSRAARIVRVGLLGLLLLAAVAGTVSLWGYRSIAGSLPRLDGERSLPGLSAPVRVERDASGVPTVTGSDRIDVARALGFLHAQERFFQMDLMRRRAAGELAEIFGEGALDLDRHHRLYRMRDRVHRAVGTLGDEERRLLDAYVAGVNAGLHDLRDPPFEYLVLRREPRPWTVEDSILVVLSMFFELNDETGSHESTEGLLRDVLPEELALFLSPAGTPWDAPVSGEAFETPPIPAGVVLDRSAPPAAAPVSSLGPLPLPTDVGSNNWVVSGTRTSDGRALLANDMHLGHAVPNIWYRVVLAFGDRRLVGVTLPGTPTLVVGSNGFVAWGFTNTNGDWTDLVELAIATDDPSRYRTPSGIVPFEVHRESIAVRDREPVELEVRETIWGPVLDEDYQGRERAVHWTALESDGVNVRLGLMENVRTVAEALEVAPTVGIPPQNLVVVDREGSIGWTVAGRIPKRVGFDGSLPGSWADGSRYWDGFLSADDYPKLVDPKSGLIWTANARVVSGLDLAKIGDGGYALGARAKQIRDDLLALTTPTEKDLLSIQLDDRALFLAPWRELFLELVHDRAELEDVERALTSGWTGRASIDSAGYRAVKELRQAVFAEVFTALTREAAAKDARFRITALRQWEGPLSKLVTERPPHLVPKPYESWEDFLRATIAKTASSWARPLEKRTWGEVNRSEIRHPMSRAVPFLSRFLDVAERPLPGDTDMPRVQGPSHGASERLVVSPGHEEDGLFHMPGGQSGHPLSPYYLGGQEDWERGRPTPLLPGPTVYELTLRP